MTWALRTDVGTDTLNLHLAELEAAGLLGIAEENGCAVAYFAERPDRLEVAGRWEAVPDRDWNAESRRRLVPVTVGDVVVTPPWATPPDTGVVVVIDPGQAFGTGHHETTTGCLAALQELDVRGRSLLDVGTGSGVLAIAAALLGAKPVVAVDIDELAVEATRRNAAENATQVDVRLGGADQVAGAFDVVVANLDTATVRAVAIDLAARLAAWGELIVSGVSLERLDEAVAALERAGLVAWPRRGEEWAVLRCRHAR